MAHTDNGAVTYPTEALASLLKHRREPIRIAQIVGKVVMGGVDQVVMNYYRHIDRTRVQFDFYMDGLDDTPLDDEIRSLGGRVFKLPAYEDSMLRNLAVFRRHLRTNNYSIVHSHVNTLSGFWLWEAKKAGVPVRIAHSHSAPTRDEWKRAVLKYALRPFVKMQANRYWACSRDAGRWQFGTGHLNAGAVRIIKNAIETERFRPDDEARMAVRSELGIYERFVVGHVGRLEHAKNHEFLLEVFAEVAERIPDAVLLLVGDGRLRRSIEVACEGRGLSDNVIIAGARQDVPRLLQAMDCFVFPSHFEGLGMAVVEAQAAGLPCLVSKQIPDEAIVTSTCRSMSLEESPRSWAEAILASRFSSVGVPESGNAVRAAGYSIEMAAPELMALYERILAESARAADGSDCAVAVR